MERKKINKTPDRPDQPIGAQERNYYGFSFRVRNVGINLNLKKLITLYQQWQKKNTYLSRMFELESLDPQLSML